MGILNKISQIIFSLSKYIHKFVNAHKGFASRSFYGETFALNFLFLNKMLDDKTKEILLSNYDKMDKSNPEFHWEFNNYALLYYKNVSRDNSVEKFLKPLIFKNTPCTNWTLLRSNARLMAKKDEILAIKEAKKKIKKYQLKSGLILDDPGVKSFQYHCFSMAMIAEMYEQTKDIFFKNSFLKGVNFIRNFILSNGETLYIGRGQNQSFGYGALIYILALAYKYTNDKTILGDIKLVLDFISKFQRKNGSFPLVMNGLEKDMPKVIDIGDPNYTGWYPYNNYFDYLPFMGFFLTKAYNILSNLSCKNIQYRKQENYRDENFIKIVKPYYEAVLSKPGGYWTNDMPIPFIVSKGKSITPMYGGEQFQKSLYSEEGIPLPYFDIINHSIRWKAKSFFKNDSLYIISPLGYMKRNYVFRDKEIIINTEVFSPFRYKHVYLELENTKSIFGNLNFVGYEYSASGKLKKYIDNSKNSIVRIKVNHD